MCDTSLLNQDYMFNVLKLKLNPNSIHYLFRVHWRISAKVV